MNRLLLIALFLLAAKAGFGQSNADSVIAHIPIYNGCIVYADSITVKGRTKLDLDTTAKNWFNSYLKEHTGCIPPNDSVNSVLGRGAIQYQMKPGMVNITFYAIVTVQIKCTDNHYSYYIYDFYLRPKSEMLHSLGYINSPEYLLGLSKKKHLGLATSMRVERGQIKEYLTKMDAAVRTCIASLNKAMAGQ